MTVAAISEAPLTPGDAASSARRLRSDLRFLRIYALTTRRVTLYRAHDEALAASDAPAEVLDRIEDGLAGEASRYRAMGWCILALLLMIPLFAGFLWSAMYWLPSGVYWWPFERGNYGLPFLSLFEWLSYLGLAAYVVVTGGLLYSSHDMTRRLGTEYRRLLALTPERQAEIAEVISDGHHPRTAYLLGHTGVFAEYGALLSGGEAR